MTAVFRNDGTEVLSLTEAAYRIGRDNVLTGDATTAAVLSAACELAQANHDPDNLDRHFVTQLIDAFREGCIEYLAR